MSFRLTPTEAYDTSKATYAMQDISDPIGYYNIRYTVGVYDTYIPKEAPHFRRCVITRQLPDTKTKTIECFASPGVCGYLLAMLCITAQFDAEHFWRFLSYRGVGEMEYMEGDREHNLFLYIGSYPGFSVGWEDRCVVGEFLLHSSSAARIAEDFGSRSVFSSHS